MNVLIIYLCIGFIVFEIACSPNDPNEWKKGLHARYRGNDRIGFTLTVILLWPLCIIGAIMKSLKGGE